MALDDLERLRQPRWAVGRRQPHGGARESPAAPGRTPWSLTWVDPPHLLRYRYCCKRCCQGRSGHSGAPCSLCQIRSGWSWSMATVMNTTTISDLEAHVQAEGRAELVT